MILTGYFEARGSLCALHNPGGFENFIIFTRIFSKNVNFHNPGGFENFIIFTKLFSNFAVDIMYIMERAGLFKEENLERIRLNCRDGVAIQVKSLHDHFQRCDWCDFFGNLNTTLGTSPVAWSV